MVAEWRHFAYEQALSNGLTRLGCDVSPVSTDEIIGNSLWTRVQKKVLSGPMISRLNREVMLRLRDLPWDVVYFRNPIYLLPETIEAVHDMAKGPVVIHCNDNPFEDGRQNWFWRHYLKGVHYADVNFFFRPRDLEHAAQRAIPGAKLLLPYYVKGLHEPAHTSCGYEFDACFVGHFEPDARVDILDAIASSGLKLGLFGPGWDRCASRRLRSLARKPVYMKEYVDVLHRSKAALCFLSSLNKDIYTTRCFEIPACGSVLVAPYNETLNTLFPNGESAILCRDPSEWLQNVRRLCSDDGLRARLAVNACARIRNMKHSNEDRAVEIIEAVL